MSEAISAADADNYSVGSHTCGPLLVHTCGVYSRLSTMSSGIPKELLIMTLTAAFGPPLAWINMPLRCALIHCLAFLARRYSTCSKVHLCS